MVVSRTSSATVNQNGNIGSTKPKAPATSNNGANAVNQLLQNALQGVQNGGAGQSNAKSPAENNNLNALGNLINGMNANDIINQLLGSLGLQPGQTNGQTGQPGSTQYQQAQGLANVSPDNALAMAKAIAGPSLNAVA